MKAQMKQLGGLVFGIAGVCALLIIPFVLLRGAAALAEWSLPFLSKAVGAVTLLVLPILVIAALVPRIRVIAAAGFEYASLFYGITLWLWALVYTLSVWSWLAVIIGLVFMGVGIVPVAMLASLFRGEWSQLGGLVMGLVLTLGTRFFGFYLHAREERRAAMAVLDDLERTFPERVP
jgi:hypothetical protein